MTGEPGLVACTPQGIITLLDHFKISIAGKHTVVIGRSLLVGKPLSLLLLNRDATVTVCHSKTANLPEITRHADILIAALGRPETITRDYIKPGATVIDVGTSRDADGKLKGDVLFADAREVAGGHHTCPRRDFGQMTIATFLSNTIDAYLSHAGLAQ